LGSTFKENSVNIKAACIYSWKSTVDVRSSEFRGNRGNQTGCIDIKEG